MGQKGENSWAKINHRITELKSLEGTSKDHRDSLINKRRVKHNKTKQKNKRYKKQSLIIKRPM